MRILPAILPFIFCGAAHAQYDFVKLREGCWIAGQFGGDETVTWSGECKDGFAHGKGRATWRSTFSGGRFEETTYEGELAYGAPQGQGRVVYSENDTYEGEFKNGEPHGFGVQREYGVTYEGYWDEGHQAGSARVTNEAGESFICRYQRSSYSVCWFPVSDKNDCRVWLRVGSFEPNGIVTWSGSCKNGNANGPGVAVWASFDGERAQFEGTFFDGAMNGYGRSTQATKSESGEEHSDTYVGGWLDSVMHGKGKEEIIHKNSSGAIEYQDTYDGEWAFNEREGDGQRTVRRNMFGSRETEVQRGSWKGGFLDGPSQAVRDHISDGERFYEKKSGRFARGQLEGFGIEITEFTRDGVSKSYRYEGEFRSSSFSKGKLTDSDGNSFEGVWSVEETQWGVCDYPKANFHGQCKEVVVFDTPMQGRRTCLVGTDDKEQTCIPGTEADLVY